MICWMDANAVVIENYNFVFVQELSPERDSAGAIRQYMPQARYEKSATTELNKHGDGAFCKFSIGSKWVGRSGVYALFSKAELLYIGLTENLHQRYNMGYGHISPMKCFARGQPTNCKINKMVLARYLGGEQVDLYFHETGDYARVEGELIRKLQPPYNGATPRISTIYKAKSKPNTVCEPKPKTTAPPYEYQSRNGTTTANVVCYIDTNRPLT